MQEAEIPGLIMCPVRGSVFNGLQRLELIGAGWRTRTPDLLITNQPLYRLS